MKINRQSWVLITAATVLGVGANGGYPAKAAGTGFSLEEIVVTAQKREQGLQDTPIAVTAFSADSLEHKRVTNISHLADFTPNMIFDTTSPVSGVSSGAVIFMRGVGQTDFGLTTDPGVGTYIDGVYSSRSVGGVLDVVDIERIEVLRGPQGTLFGRNTMGGAIDIITRKPGDEFSGRIEITGGNFSRIDARASVELPLSETLSTSLAFSTKKRDGFVDRLLAGDELGDEDRQSFRAALRYAPTDDIEIHATLDYANIDENSAGSVLVGITGSAGTPSQNPGTSTFAYDVFRQQNPGLGLSPYQDFLLGDPRSDRTFATGPTGTNLDIYGGALTINWSQGVVGLKSITALRKTEGGFFRDPDNAPVQITETSNPDYRHKQFSQELQLSGDAVADRFHYVAGVYYFKEDGTDNVFVPIFGLVPGGVALPLFINNFADVDNKSVAAYAQGTYDLTENFSLTLGVRRTRDDKGFSYRQFVSADPEGTIFLLPLVGSGGRESTSREFKETTFRAGLEYAWGEQLRSYLTYSEGFKSGGFNFRYVVPRPAPLPFDPETLRSLELGVKWQGLNDRLRINSAAFVMDYRDVQVVLFEAGGGPLIQNSGEADIKGVEVEMSALVSENFLLEAALGYTDAKYDRLNLPTTNVTQPITLDSKLPNTPETTVSLSAAYTIPTSWGAWALRLDYRYTDDIFNDAQNSPFLFQPSYSVWNGSITYTSADESWDVVLFGNNLSDKRYITSGDSNFGLGFHEANFNRPRDYGITVRKRF